MTNAVDSKKAIQRAAYMSYETAIRANDEIMEEISAYFDSLPKGPMGLTPDEIKFSAEFQMNKGRYDHFNEMNRSLRKNRNKVLGLKVANRIARELQAERRAEKIAANTSA